MANELSIRLTTGLTLYAQRTRASDGYVWSTVGSAYEAPTAANWGNYDVAMAESSTTGWYFGTDPDPGTLGGYTVFRQAGGSPATTDVAVGAGELGTQPANVTQISGDADAADNLETMLDGTGGQTLSLGRLVVDNSSGSDSAVYVVSAPGGTAVDLRASGGGPALAAIATDTGHGIYCSSSGGSALRLTGSSNGHGLYASASGTGHAVYLTATGGGNSLRATAATGSDVVYLDATGTTPGKSLNAPDGITANITGDITGNLSGSVGSVTGAVGSVTGAVGSVTGSVGSLGAAAQGNVRTAVGLAAANLDTQLDAIKADTAATLLDTGTDGVVLSAATCNKIADHARRRTQANVEASSDGDALSLGSLYGFIQQAQKSLVTAPTVLTIYGTDGSTTLGTKTLTVSAAADPVTGIS